MKLWDAAVVESIEYTYRKVTSSRPVYYSILNSFGQRVQYISIKFPLHKQSENPKMFYYPRQSTARDFTLCYFLEGTENIPESIGEMNMNRK